jgi:type I restriction enzyme, S subunit
VKWPTTQLKRVALLIPGGTPSVDEPRFWSANGEGTSWVTIADMTRSTPVASTARQLTAEGLVSKRLKVGAAGTVLFAMYASVGAVNVLGHAAAWNQAILGLEPRPGLSYTRFLAYWLQSLRPRLSELFRSNTQDNINAEQVGSLPFPSIPLQDQRAIASFLDAETARIDALIIKKRELRRLLQVRAAALRTAAFNAAPGWRLKQLLKAPLAYGVLVPRLTTDDSGAIMLRINALTQDGRIDLERAARIEPTQSIEYRRTVVAAGDLVLSVVGSMGRSAVVTSAAAGANLNRPLARLQPRAYLPTSLLWHWTQTDQFAMQARLATGGDTAQPTLNLGDLAEFKVGLPKEKGAWPAILQALDRGLKPINMTDNRLQLQIELLLEHRQALITAAVTGELDIRGAAA